MTADGTTAPLGDDPALIELSREGRTALVVGSAGEILWSTSAADGLLAGGLHPSSTRALAVLAAEGSWRQVSLRPAAGEDMALEDMASEDMASVAFDAEPVWIGDTPGLLLIRAAEEPAAETPAAQPVASLDLSDAPPDPRRISSEQSVPAAVVAAGAEATAIAEGAPLLDDATPIHDEPPLEEPDAVEEPRFDQALLRFVFETDAGGRFTYLSPDLEKTVGESARAALGSHWDEFAAGYGVDPAGAVSNALKSRSSWGDLTVGWPGFDGRRFPVILSALPIFDRGRTFTGFRGLGRAAPAPVVDQRPEAPVLETPSAPLAEASAHEDPVIEMSAEIATGSGVEPIETASENAEVTAAAPEPSETEVVASEPAAGDQDLAEPESASPPQEEFREEPLAIIDTPLSTESFKGNVVPLRDMAPRLAGLSSMEERAFDEIARRLRRIDERDPLPSAAVVETAEIAALPKTGDWTIDDVDGRAPTSSRVEDLIRLLDRVPVGAVVLRAGEIDYANRAALDMLGHADLAGLAARGAETLFSEQPKRDDAAPATVRMISADGIEIEAEAKLQSIAWRGGPATLVSLKRAEGSVAAAHAALEREREASEILESAADGVVTLDGAGRILSINRSAEALFGFEAREVIGSLFTLSLAPESRKLAFDSLDRQRANGGAARDTFEVLGLSRHGGSIPLQMTLGRIGAGETDRFCAVLRDIAPWKRAEEELIGARRQAERANAQKSDFLAKVGREIRTPLNAIIGFADVMTEERFGPIGNARYKDYLRDIQVSGAHLISLVNDLLDITRVESGAMKLEFTAVDLNEIAAQAAALLQPQASRDHIIIRTSLARSMPPVLADRRSVRQIMTNLAANAVKFSRPGGQVILATALTDVGQAVIRVRDAGAGMTRQELARAFEPFRPLADNDAGGSLGLPLTKALAEANQAALALQSELGHGTLAEVTFPASRVLAG